MNWPTRLLAWWRLLWGNCPNCNCDAPATDDCRVCGNYRHAHGGLGWQSPPWSLRMFWMTRMEEEMEQSS